MASSEKHGKEALSSEGALEYTLDTGERLRLVSLIGGYRYKQIEGRPIMLELGNPAILLLMAYLLTLPGIIMEFLFLKKLWYFGFNLYSLYVFILALGCVGVGFYLIFRKIEDYRAGFRTANERHITLAIVIATASLLLLILLGRDSLELAIVFSITFIFSAILAITSAPNVRKKDVMPIALYGAGIVVISLAPVHQAFGIWSENTGQFQLGILDWMFVVLGVSMALLAINTIRSRMGLFSCWLLGAMVIVLVSFHEIVEISSSNVFEIYDQVLALVGCVFSVVPLILYFMKERESSKLWSYLLNAMRALDQKSYERAQKEANKAIEILAAAGLSNKLALPWSIQGDINFRIGNFNKARMMYDMALSIDPNDPETLSNLGSMLAFKGYGEQALLKYQKAAKLYPDDPKIWNNLGVVLLSLRRYSEALVAFERAKEIDRSFSSAYYNAGMILMRSGKPAAAMRRFSELIRMDPEDEGFRKAYERAKFLLRCFQQAAGWKIMGLDVSELMRTVLQNPGEFEERYREFLKTVIQNLSLGVFNNERDRATVAMQNIITDIKKSSKSVQKLRIDSGLNLDQLRFSLAALILARRAEFSKIRNEIRLVPGRRERRDTGFDDPFNPYTKQQERRKRGSPTAT